MGGRPPKRISRDQYERLVPAVREASIVRQQWGVGDHVYLIDKNPDTPAKVRAFLDAHACDGFIHTDAYLGTFVEFKDPAGALLFYMRFA